MTGGPGAHSVRITTLNLLHDQIRNVLPAWTVRRPRAVATLRAIAPDVVCLQEVSARQLADLGADLPEFEIVAGAAGGPIRLAPWFAPLAPLGRMWWGDYFDHGEWCPILLRRGVVEPLAIGWFSIELPGKRVWSAATPHGVTWARVRLVRTELEVWIANTHLGLLPWRAADNAKRLIAALDREWNGSPQFLAGDFNARPEGPVLARLQSERGPHTPSFRDLWKDATERRGPAGSYDTLPWLFGCPRIDYVLARPAMTVLRAEITEFPGGAARASDHRPVTVDVVI